MLTSGCCAGYVGFVLLGCHSPHRSLLPCTRPTSPTRPAWPLQTSATVRCIRTVKSRIESWRAVPLSPPVYRSRNKVKETETCPRSHSQQGSELGFERKPAHSQSRPSLCLVELPSRAPRLDGTLQAQTGKGNRCHSLPRRQECEKRGC